MYTREGAIACSVISRLLTYHENQPQNGLFKIRFVVPFLRLFTVIQEILLHIALSTKYVLPDKYGIPDVSTINIHLTSATDTSLLAASIIDGILMCNQMKETMLYSGFEIGTPLNTEVSMFGTKGRFGY